MVLLGPSSVGPSQLVKFRDERQAMGESHGEVSSYGLQNIVNVVRSTGDQGARGVTVQLISHSSKQFMCPTGKLQSRKILVKRTINFFYKTGIHN